MSTDQTAQELINQEQPSWMRPTDFSTALQIAEYLAASDMVPKAYQNKPHNVVVAMMFADQMGLAYMAALQGVAVINGIPAVYGDLMLAIVRGSGKLDFIRETLNDEGTESAQAVCTVKRKGDGAEVRRAFSMADAKRAGLLSKSGPWQQYPMRMLQLRARAFALRDVFADVLRGIQCAEELQDIPQPTLQRIEHVDDIKGKPDSETAGTGKTNGDVADLVDAANQKQEAAKKRAGTRKKAPDASSDALPAENTTDSASEAASDADAAPEDVTALQWIRPIFKRWADRLGAEDEFIKVHLANLWNSDQINSFASILDDHIAPVVKTHAMITDNERGMFAQFVERRQAELTADLA